MAKRSPRSWTKDVDWKFVVPLPFIPVVLAIVLMPKIQHALDFGRDVVPVAKLGTGHAFTSRNLTITDAVPLTQLAVQLTTSRVEPTSERVMNVDQFIPLVPPGWQAGDAIPVIMKVAKGIDTRNKLDARATEPGSFTGVARNIMWEGVPSDIKTIFQRDAKARLADDVLLLSLEDDKLYDYMLAAAIPFSLFIVVIAGWAALGPAWREERERRQRIARNRPRAARGTTPPRAVPRDDAEDADADDDDDNDDDDNDDDEDDPNDDRGQKGA